MTNWRTIKAEIQGPSGFAAWVRGRVIPSGIRLAEEARQRVFDRLWSGAEPNEEQLSAMADWFFSEVVDTEYQLYLEYEERCVAEAIPLALTQEAQSRYPQTAGIVSAAVSALEDVSVPNVSRLTQAIEILRPCFKRFEQSLAQGRMTRAGGSAQYHFEYLLNRLGYSGEFETQKILNGKVDFLFPSEQAWRRDRQRCIILSVKRSLRERYKQVFEELGITGGLSVYLLVTQTSEEARKDLTPSKIDQMRAQNVYLVVRDAVKQSLFPSEPRVLGLTDFLFRELPLRRQLWKPLVQEGS